MILRKIRNYFFAGLLVTVPMGITVWIVWSIFNLLDGWYRHLVKAYGTGITSPRAITSCPSTASASF